MWKRILVTAALAIAFFALIKGKTILFIGDSITDGNWGSPSKYPCSSEERNRDDKNHILGHGFAEMTAGYFMGEFPDSDYNFINRGISGETLGQIASRWQKDAIDLKPDIISLLCGTNDIHYWLQQNPESIEEFDFNSYAVSLDSLILTTREALPECRIILATPFVGNAGWVGKAPDYKLREAGVDSIAAITRQIALKHRNQNQKIDLVDFNLLKSELIKQYPDTSYWIWDGIHPTTSMHYRMSKLWIEKDFLSLP